MSIFISEQADYEEADGRDGMPGLFNMPINISRSSEDELRSELRRLAAAGALSDWSAMAYAKTIEAELLRRAGWC